MPDLKKEILKEFDYSVVSELFWLIRAGKFNEEDLKRDLDKRLNVFLKEQME